MITDRGCPDNSDYDTMHLFALITFIIAAVGAILLARVFLNAAPGTSRLKSDLQQMKVDMDKWAGELIPLTDEELELLSFNQEKKVVKTGITKTAKGIYTTIYHEPILAYSYKEYAGKGKSALLYVRTARHEFVYTVKKQGIKIAMDGQSVGVLKQNGILYSSHTQKALANIKRDELDLHPVIVNNREVANVVVSKEGESKVGERAFEFVQNDLTNEEREVFLSLGILEVVQQSLSK